MPAPLPFLESVSVFCTCLMAGAFHNLVQQWQLAANWPTVLGADNQPTDSPPMPYQFICNIKHTEQSIYLEFRCQQESFCFHASKPPGKTQQLPRFLDQI